MSLPVSIAQESTAVKPATGPVTAQAISDGLKEVDSAELEDAVKTQLKDRYAEAKRELDVATERQTDADRFRRWTENASADIESAKAQQQALPQYDFGQVEGRELTDLANDLAKLDQQLVDTRQQLADAQGEPQRRIARIAAIPGELNTALEALTAIQKQQETTEDPEAGPAARAQRILFSVREQAQQALITKLQNERDAYEAQDALPLIRVDLLTALVKQLEQDAQELRRHVDERRRSDVGEQQAEAEALQARVPQSLKPAVQDILELVDRRLNMVELIKIASARRSQVVKQRARWEKDFERTKQRATIADADTNGQLLSLERANLPSLSLLNRSLSDDAEKLGDYQAELYRLESRRFTLSDSDAARAAMRANLPADQQTATLDTDLDEVVRLERQVLDSLLSDANRHYTLRVSTQEQQQQLADVVAAYRFYIERTILWVRSTSSLSKEHIGDAASAFAWLFSQDAFAALQEPVRRHWRRSPVQFAGLILVVAALFLMRGSLRRRLTHAGQLASASSCQSMRPTINAIVITALLVAAWPVVVFTLSWLLDSAENQALRAMSGGFSALVVWLLAVELWRHSIRPNGLVESHFGWVVHGELRRHCHVALLVGTPLFFLGAAMQRSGETAYIASLGRLSLMVVLLLVAWSSFRLSRVPRLFATRKYEPTQRSNRIQAALGILVTLLLVLLAILAAAGYQYSAHEVGINALLSFLLVFCLLMAHACLVRWLTVTRRRLRLEQLKEQLKREAEHEESEASDIYSLVAQEEETDLAAMGRQSRRLIGVGMIVLGLVGMGSIWFEVFPALAPVFEQVLYTARIDSDELRSVTVGGVLFAILMIALTVTGCRNISGLVDVFLMGRLEVESSIRYAVATIAQYVIAVTGALLAFNTLGFSWNKLQWLAAAMSVGLGFGLQEVVANFVCGIILLFERPIRFGDVVTLGDTTGVVIRIRSRATTVRNWDRQEVVIPNKELITGRIINWTLSDGLNRIVFQVGIAYGSDTDRARVVLEELLHENPLILDDPPPSVTFGEFGDSTLNFTVRAFLEKMGGTFRRFASATHGCSSTLSRRRH